MSLASLVELGKGALSITRMCALLSIARSTYYAQRKPKPPGRSLRCRALVACIQAVFAEHQARYGAPRICRALRKQGFRVSQKTVAKQMRAEGLIARPKKRFRPQTTDSNHEGPFAPNLLQQDFSAAAPNQKWAGDITFVRIGDSWAYLAVVLDLFSRRVVGWAIGPSCDGKLAAEALGMAVRLRKPPPGLIVHTDRGSTYVSAEYKKVIKDAGAIASMSRTGNCYDNSVVESFFSTLEFELRQYCQFETLRQAHRVLGDYIDNYYNAKRMHSTLDYNSPIEYEQILAAAA